MLTADPIGAAIARLELRKQKAAPKTKAESYTKSFREFIADVFPVFGFSRHTERLIAIGQQIADGKLPRAMVELPPRHFKSTIFSRFLPAYFVRRYPSRTVGIGAHNNTLATEFGQACRDYFVASGGTLDPSAAGKERWKTHEGGGVWVAGIGKGTGMPADLLIVDDPIKGREEADSAAVRRQVHNWWDSVLNTREEPNDAKVIIHTRWHKLDLIGYLLKKNEELEKEGLEEECEPWHVVSLPIEAKPANNIKPLPKTVTRERDYRQPGEALDPTRYDERWIRRKKANTPARDWDAIYQQDPTDAQGTIFKADHIGYFILPGETGLPNDVVLTDVGIRRIASLDSTFKDSAGTDMVGIGMWLQTQEAMYRLDQINRRMGFNDTLDTLRALQPAWKFDTLLVEDKANGSAIIDTLKREARGYSVIEVDPMGGKVARAEAAAVQFKQRRVFIHRHAPWRAEYVGQLLEFPSGTFDDLVDETSQVVNFAAGTGPMRFTTVSYGYSAGDYAVADDDDENIYS